MSNVNDNFTQGTLAIHLPNQGSVAVGTSNHAALEPGVLTVGKQLSLQSGGLGSSNFTTLTASANTSNYQITLPQLTSSNLPFPQNSLSFNQQGQAQFISTSFSSAFAGNGSQPPVLVNSGIVYTNTASSIGGKVTFTVTNTGAAAGQAVFNKIPAVSAAAHLSSANPNRNQCLIVGGHNIVSGMITCYLNMDLND